MVVVVVVFPLSLAVRNAHLAQKMDTSLKPQVSVDTNNLKQSIKAGLLKKKLLVSPTYELKGIVQIQNANNVHLGHSVTFDNARSKDAKPDDPVFELTPQIKALFENNQEVTHTERQAVVSQVGDDWRFLGRELANFSNPQMDQLEAPFKAHQQPFNEVIYQMLLQWEERSHETPTIGTLARALHNCEMFDALLSLLKTVEAK